MCVCYQGVISVIMKAGSVCVLSGSDISDNAGVKRRLRADQLHKFR